MSRINKSQQLRDLIDYFAKGNNSEFARILGMSPQGVSTWLSRGNFDIELIYSKCEGLNPEWLLTGEGDMLKENFFFKTKTPENVVKENDHNNDHNNDHKRKLRKTWSNKQYKITGSTPPIAAENQVPYQASRSQQGKGRIIDSSYLEIEIPPERRGIRNMFSGFTDEEIEKAMLEQFVNNVLDMFKTGEAIAPNTMKDIIKQKDDEINELRAKLWQYESAYGPVPPGDNKPFAPHVDNNDKRNPDK